MHFSHFLTILIGPICPLWPHPETPSQIPHRRGHLYRRPQRQWPPGSSPWPLTAPPPQGIRLGAPLVQWNWNVSRARAWELALLVSARYTLQVVFSVGASYCGWFQNKYIHFMQFLFNESKDIIKQVRSKFLHAHIIPSHNLFKKVKGVSSYTQF